MAKNSRTRYIFVTGGVVSSLGKGVAAATLGALLQSRGYGVHTRKLEAYLNIDCKTMSPLRHGEVYVTADGGEADLDLGYYERFLGIKMSRNDSVSTGRVYWEVLNAERRGEYNGRDVQLIPHVSDHIKKYIKWDEAASGPAPDFIFYEIGGTVGDIEGLIILEAARQFANEVGRKNAMFVHLTLAPFIETANELKTKPTQQSVRILLEKGILADMLIVRTPRMLDTEEREKIALFCNLSPEFVISGMDMDSIYKIPLAYEAQGVTQRILEHFGLDASAPGDLSKFQKIADYLATSPLAIGIAVVGRYFQITDAYKSLSEALFHAGIANNIRVNIRKIDAEGLEKMTAAQIKETFDGANGILVPGGSDSKMVATKFARENNIPYLGINAGLQIATTEFMQNVCGVNDVDSDAGGNLRLGAYPCVLTPGTLAAKVYGKTEISERHRHRYELNIKHKDILEKNGMIISGMSLDGCLPEIVEIPAHPFFVAVQFNPEFQSSPYTSHPLFAAFIKATASQ